MRNFVSVVFDDKAQAYDDKAQAYRALHELWQLDFAGEITVHGTTVVHRDARDRITVDAKDTHPVFATVLGVGLGAVLGAMAGPAGVAIGIGAGAALGAATGAVIGGAVDLERANWLTAFGQCGVSQCGVTCTLMNMCRGTIQPLLVGKMRADGLVILDGS